MLRGTLWRTDRLATLKAIVEGPAADHSAGEQSAEALDTRIDALLGQFARIRELITQGQPLICLTATPDDIGLDVQPMTRPVYRDAPTGRPSWPRCALVPQARTTDTPVAFNAVAFATVPYTHPDSPALLVLSRLLRSEYLLKELREKGGAYGGGASFDTAAGGLPMTSYRDPHIARTYQVFRDARVFSIAPWESAS